jgi:hypothetical protein
MFVQSDSYVIHGRSHKAKHPDYSKYSLMQPKYIHNEFMDAIFISYCRSQVFELCRIS